MINLSQNSRAYSIPYSCKMIFCCFITTTKMFTLLLYHLHVSLGLQLLKNRPRINVQKKSITIEHFIGGNQSIISKSHAEIPISTYTKLIVPLCEAKVQEGRIGLNDMV